MRIVFFPGKYLCRVNPHLFQEKGLKYVLQVGAI